MPGMHRLIADFHRQMTAHEIYTSGGYIFCSKGCEPPRSYFPMTRERAQDHTHTTSLASDGQNYRCLRCSPPTPFEPWMTPFPWVQQRTRKGDMCECGLTLGQHLGWNCPASETERFRPTGQTDPYAQTRLYLQQTYGRHTSLKVDGDVLTIHHGDSTVIIKIDNMVVDISFETKAQNPMLLEIALDTLEFGVIREGLRIVAIPEVPKQSTLKRLSFLHIIPVGRKREKGSKFYMLVGVATQWALTSQDMDVWQSKDEALAYLAGSISKYRQFYGVTDRAIIDAVEKGLGEQQ